MSQSTGRVTLPIEEGIDEQLRTLVERIGADAVRNSDGTWLPQIAHELVDTVYSTYFPARGDQQWALEHPDTLVNQYLMSRRVTASAQGPLQITVTDGYLRDQIQPCYERVERFWEVIDRTTGEVVPPERWSVDTSDMRGVVTIADPEPWHVYTVSFLAEQLWDSTQMYNYITNNWQEDPTRVKERPYDVRKPGVWEHCQEALQTWLAQHPEVDVVRFTTFFYHFTLVFDEQEKERFVDWFGYSASVSPQAIDAFEEEYGVALRAEDFVDAGYYNSPFRVPSPRFRQWIDFTSRYVADKTRELVSLTHEAGREAMMFLGDNWIGTEPYGPYFPSIGVDAVVGSAGSAATTRLIADIPGVRYTEVRFLPYFFPDVFHEGGEPVEEANASWLSSRRAILRSPIDRMGYGGYVSLALQFEDFIERICEIAQEFREIHERSGSQAPATEKCTVAVLNCWGALRSWQTHMVAHALPYKQTEPYVGVLESLAGLPVDVHFVSFDDLREAGGVPEGIDVLINAGAAGTAFSGGPEWADPEICSMVRHFVAQGGGFIGVGEPTAVDHGGAFFQLSDVLGVEQERQFTLSTAHSWETVDGHPIMEDALAYLDCDPLTCVTPPAGGDVYATGPQTQVLRSCHGSVEIAVNHFGQGRSVYFTGLPYNAGNSRLLLRALMWASGRDDAQGEWWTSHEFTELAVYPEQGVLAVANNSMDQVSTTITGPGFTRLLTLHPMQLAWVEYR